jgi:NAD(P)H dehydrogenase (quinone)
VTTHDVANVLGSGAHYVDRTREKQRAVLEALGMPPLRVDVLVGLDDLFRDEIYATPTPTVQALTGRPARSVGDYAREFASPSVA